MCTFEGCMTVGTGRTSNGSAAQTRWSVRLADGRPQKMTRLTTAPAASPPIPLSSFFRLLMLFYFYFYTCFPRCDPTSISEVSTYSLGCDFYVATTSSLCSGLLRYNTVCFLSRLHPGQCQQCGACSTADDAQSQAASRARACSTAVARACSQPRPCLQPAAPVPAAHSCRPFGMERGEGGSIQQV